MSEEKENPCLFNNDIQCPARKAMKDVEEPPRSEISQTLDKACLICPKRIKMIPSSKIK